MNHDIILPLKCPQLKLLITTFPYIGVVSDMTNDLASSNGVDLE